MFGSRIIARWPQHLVLDGLDTIELLLETGNLTIHPRCTAPEGRVSELLPPAPGRPVDRFPGRWPSGRRPDGRAPRRHSRCLAGDADGHTESPPGSGLGDFVMSRLVACRLRSRLPGPRSSRRGSVRAPAVVVVVDGDDLAVGAEDGPDVADVAAAAVVAEDDRVRSRSCPGRR